MGTYPQTNKSVSIRNGVGGLVLAAVAALGGAGIAMGVLSWLQEAKQTDVVPAERELVIDYGWSAESNTIEFQERKPE